MMPLYDYHCTEHGDFRAWRGLSEARAPTPCPDCARPAFRSMAAPALAILPSVTRRAHERNEKSAHEPKLVTREHGHGAHAGHGHGHAHAHGHGGGGRPWMIGH